MWELSIWNKSRFKQNKFSPKSPHNWSLNYFRHNKRSMDAQWGISDTDWPSLVIGPMWVIIGTKRPQFKSKMLGHNLTIYGSKWSTKRKKLGNDNTCEYLSDLTKSVCIRLTLWLKSLWGLSTRKFQKAESGTNNLKNAKRALELSSTKIRFNESPGAISLNFRFQNYVGGEMRMKIQKA